MAQICVTQILVILVARREQETLTHGACKNVLLSDMYQLSLPFHLQYCFTLPKCCLNPFLLASIFSDCFSCAGTFLLILSSIWDIFLNFSSHLIACCIQ